MDPAALLAEGIEHFERWQATRSPADLDSAIATFTRLDAAVPAGHALRFWADLLQAMALGNRYTLSDSVDDINGAIVRLKRIIADPSPPPGVGQPELDSYHVALGRALANRINMYGQPGGPPPSGDAEFLDELQTAIDELALAATTGSEQVTLAERAEAAALRAHLVPKLVLTRSIIARKARRQADVAELERVLGETPADHPNRPHLILEAGFAHLQLILRSAGRADCLAQAEHRALAERYLSAAVELLDRGYPERAKAIAFLRYLSLTRRPRSPGAPAGRPDQLLARELADPGPDQAVNAVLHLVAGMAASPESSPADLAAAAAHFSQAMALARDAGTAGHLAGFLTALPAAIRGAFLGLLSNPHATSPSLDDQEAADVHGRRFLRLLAEDGLLEQVAGEMPGFAGALVMLPAFLQGMAASERLHAASRDGDLAGVDAALAELERHLAELPPDHGYQWMLLARVGAGWRERGTLSGAAGDTIRGLETLVTAMDQAAACTPVARIVPDANRTALQRAASAAARLGRLTRDPRVLTVALGRMSALRTAPGMTPAERAGLSQERGMTLLWRHGLAHDPRDLDQAITELAEASQIAGEDASYGLLQNLSVAHWARGDRARGDQERALETGLTALRQRAAAVLLQSGVAHGLQVARTTGSDEVPQLVRWCLAEGRADLAVEALELGRALVLHAATVTTDIPGLLTLAGHDALAGQWRAETGRGPARTSGPAALLGPAAFGPPGDFDVQPPPRVPSLLRRQVLDALRGIPAGAQLLAAPRLAELSEALRLADADAYVYLIPAHREQGWAMLVHADGGIGHLPLPGLSQAAALDAYEQASQAATRSDGDDMASRGTWRQALDALCDWAWDAVTAPVLRTLAEHQPGRRDQPGTAPRIVLIPAGRLGVVPWHAARTPDTDGQPRYAVQDAVFSYAASAGQFARASRLRSRPWSAAPLLLSDPTGELGMARLEVAELMSRYYPDAVFLGLPPGLADGPGRPDEVLSRLPGGSAPPASLVHCGCHADVAPSLAGSHLRLADGQLLSIADILAQASRHDRADAGFLGVLSACLTDLAHVDHDEALTLASALLAAGACAVVGARWPASERVTAPMMVMFHHFLNNGHHRPADALRAAQLWMLDTARVPLDGLPPRLANAAGPGSLLAAPHAWAAFTCHGA
jgi:hypothetical protein